MTNGTAEIDESELTIGTRTVHTRYLLAPLAGYTQVPLRRALRELGGLGLATTDLVHAGQLVLEKAKSLVIVDTTPDDTPLSVQIFGAHAQDMVAAARWLEDRGYQAIDINMGCPMAKVNGSGGGARLMCDATGAARLVAAVVAAVKLPVTVKMRLGWDRSQLTAPELARQVAEAGAAAVTIHGRTRAQGFHGSVDLEGIAAVVDRAAIIPVIGNGDVRTVAEAHAMRRHTGCAAVAIGRGAMLDPWIFRKLADSAQGREPREPTAAEQVQFLRRHVALLAEQRGDRACVLIRKFAAWYGQQLGMPEDVEDRLRRLETLCEFEQLAHDFERRHGQRQQHVATALIRTPNGPVELW